MKPLWLQKHKDDGKRSEKHAKTIRERRASAISAHNLTKDYEFDRVLKAPNLWKKGVSDLQKEAHEEGDEEDEGDEVPREIRSDKLRYDKIRVHRSATGIRTGSPGSAVQYCTDPP